MRKFNFRPIIPKDSKAKLRVDAMNAVIDEKISKTIDFSSREVSIIAAKDAELKQVGFDD